MITLMITIATMNLLAAMSPGPDFAIVSHNAASGGRRAGIATTFGVASALLIHVSYCSLGLTIISQSTYLLLALRLIGGAYVIYLGIKALRSLPTKTRLTNNTASTEPAKFSFFKAYQSGFLVCALNAKAILFIISMLTLIHSHHLSWYQYTIITLEIPLVALAWFSTLSWIITHPRIYRHYQQHLPTISRGFGVFLILVGTWILVK